MTSAEQDFADLYGPPAEHSDYQLGQSVEYMDAREPSGRARGLVLYIAAATTKEPQRLIVSPDTALFPIEITAAEIVEDPKRG